MAASSNLLQLRATYRQQSTSRIGTRELLVAGGRRANRLEDGWKNEKGARGTRGASATNTGASMERSIQELHFSAVVGGSASFFAATLIGCRGGDEEAKIHQTSYRHQKKK